MTSITSLIERIEAATFETQHAVIYDALVLFHRQSWITDNWYDVAMEMRRAGAFLDAVMTLMPEGYAVTDLMIWPDEPSSATIVGTTRRPFGKDHRMSWVHGAGDGTWRGNGSTAPLALLAAILRARQTEAR
jgi:hypothetical protein